MKVLFHKLIRNILAYYYKSKIPKITQEIFVKPIPIYINQFIHHHPLGSKSNDIIKRPDLAKKFGAKNTTGYTYWAWRSCGIACVKMILNSKKTMMTLIQEGLDLGGYHIPTDTGWYHQSLAELLTKNNYPAITRKFQSLESIVHAILNNQMVIASVKKYGGHLILLTGVKLEGGNILGVFAHDPGLGPYKKNLFISSQEFTKIFTGRTICTLN